MADVTRIKNGFLLECDCGLNHKVTIDSESKEIKCKTTYSKKPVEEVVKPETKTEIKKEEVKKDEENESVWFE